MFASSRRSFFWYRLVHTHTRALPLSSYPFAAPSTHEPLPLPLPLKRRHHHRSTLIASIHPRHNLRVFLSLFHLYSTIQIQINPILFFTYSFISHFLFFFATNMAMQCSNSVYGQGQYFF